LKVAISLLFLVPGLVLLLGAIFKWGWMMRSRRSRFIVEKLGIEQGRVVYGVIGTVAIIIALIVMLTPRVDQTLAGKPDVMTILKVEADGCTVTRSEVNGTTAVKDFQWKVTSLDFQLVGTRTTEDELSYRYPKAGEYQVVFQAWYHGAYVTISNKVDIHCSN
jgi:hypothetical protein